MPNRVVALIALAAVTIGCSSGNQSPAESAGGGAAQPALKYTAIPDQNTTELQEKFRPLSAYLTQGAWSAGRVRPGA